jgi:hypothetical protein
MRFFCPYVLSAQKLNTFHVRTYIWFVLVEYRKYPNIKFRIEYLAKYKTFQNSCIVWKAFSFDLNKG